MPDDLRPILLGPGHVATWLRDPDTDEIIGLAEHHDHARLNQGAFPKCGGGGYIAWKASEGGGIKPTGHTITAGGPDDPEHLTINPSLWHRAKDQADKTLPLHANGSRCSPHPGCHGWIRNGRWVDA